MLIGLTGNKGSGKTTAANHLVGEHGFFEKSFADPLKAACQALFLFDDSQVYGTQLQKETPDPRWFGATPRQTMQYVGTELLRDQLDRIMPGLGKDVFIHHFRLWYQERAPNNVVISDVRFKNEAAIIRELGGVICRIKRGDVSMQDMHQSERELLEIEADYVIENNGSLDLLYDRLNIIASMPRPQ